MMTALLLMVGGLSVEALLTLLVLTGLFLVLLLTPLPTDMVFVGALSLLMLAGVLEPERALAGFGSQGLVTVGALYVVVAGLQETGGIQLLTRWLLRPPGRSRLTHLRLLLPISGLSAFLNNTPVVAILIPPLTEWCRRHRLQPSQFLIPLSYASILGGMCTLVGTSTNLVVNSLYVSRYGGPGIPLFALSLVGVPCALAGLIYLTLGSQRLLPRRDGARAAFSNPQSYTLELVVHGKSPLLGVPLADNEVRKVHDAYLAELIRDGKSFAPPPMEETLQEGDRLLFVGNLTAMRQLLRIKGVQLAADEGFARAEAPGDRRLVEAVVSHTCPLVGKSLREGRFRQQYNAVVIAMSRNGERLQGSLAGIPLRAGDVLLIESHAGFLPRQRESGDFYLLHELGDEVAIRTPARAGVSFAILLLMVLSVGLGGVSMLKASMLAAGLMLATGCCTAARARRRIEWHVLMVIGAALGLGAALEQSGAARALATGVMSLSGGSAWGTLALIYLATVICTELITNNAAVALMFPMAMEAAERLEVSPLPFLFSLMIAGSASFLTPIGYQTNLMVYGAGGYRFADYFRFGLPVTLLVGAICLTLSPLIWPF